MDKETLITVHQNVKEIHRVLERVKRDAKHRWWDTLFRWSPAARGVLNKLCHPIIVLFIWVLIGFVLSAILYIMDWRMMKWVIQLISILNIHKSVTVDTSKVIDTRQAI